MSKLISLLISFIVLSGILFSITLFYLYYLLISPISIEKEQLILISKGSSVKTICEKLVQGAIVPKDKEFMLLVIAKLYSFNSSFKAGEYLIEPHQSIKDVFEIFSSGKSYQHKFTLVEGVTSFQVKANLEQIERLKGVILDIPEEGSLLPETYSFIFGDDRSSLILRMQEAQKKVLEELWNNRQEQYFKNKDEAIILASIVEKETGLKDERKRVAAVFLNRLKKQMKLQADPTVSYSLTMGKYTLEKPLTFSDLKFDSPYNTYLYSGLPPTPICNPSKASLEAVLFPVQTNELYFVANNLGGHFFASTLKEHNENVKRYRNHK